MKSAILAWVFGVWCLQQMPQLPALSWALCLILPALVASRLRTGPSLPCRWLRWGLCVLTAAGVGYFWAATMATVRLADALPPAWEGRDVQLVGVVASLPRIEARGERFLFDVEAVETPGAKVPQRIALMRYFAGFRETPPQRALAGEFHAGERWRLTVRLKQPHGSYNPHGFDFEVWALERDIRASGYLRNGALQSRLSPLAQRPAYWLEHARERIRARMASALGEARYAGVLIALAIGDDSAIHAEDWQVFLRTGVNHLMSISGLHVTMVASLAFGLTLLGWRRLPWLALRLPARKAAALAGLLAALAYALIAGFAVPTQRTLYMLAVVAAALWRGRVVSMALVLCWALLVVVLIDPWAVLAPGFWLSFGAVGLLAYAGSGRLVRPHWLGEAAHAQWVVTLGLTPLLLALFQQVSLISPLANAFAIPIISLIVTPLALLGAILPWDILLLASHAVMSGCMALLQWCSRLPVAVWQQHAPPAWTVLLALAGVVWALLPRGVPLRWFGAMAMLPMLLLLPPPPRPGELRLTVLDVGQGLAVVAQTAHHALLYDAGPRYSEEADSGNRIILPYLRGAGIGRLDGMVITHDDIDHTGGVASVLQGIAVGWLASSLPAGHPVLADARQPLPCFGGQTWQWDGVRFAMLHPGWDSYAIPELKDNARGCTLKISSPYGSALLPADIEARSEQQLLERVPESLPADILVAPHHGSLTSSTPEFIAQVQPRATIFTVGYRNRFGHPKPAVLERYLAAQSRIYRSDQEGAVLIDFSHAGIVIRPWRREAPRYWQVRGQSSD